MTKMLALVKVRSLETEGLLDPEEFSRIAEFMVGPG
jgi:hypothetical protein